MPATKTFTKTIARPGKFFPTSPLRGRHKEPFEITPERIHHWNNQFKRMKEKGNVLPAPVITHKTTDRPVSLDELHAKIKRGEYDREAGWWSNIWIETGADGPELKGHLEVPEGKEETAQSFKYVSPFIDPNWTDGTGEKFQDSIQHILLTNKPIAPDQGDFEPVEGKPMTTGLAFFADAETGEDATPTPDAGAAPTNTMPVENTKLTAVVAALAKKFGVDPPTGISNADELLSWVAGVIAAVPKPEGAEGTTTTPPEGAATETPAPVAMSHLVQSNPQVAALFSNVQRSEQEKYAERINNLVLSGRVTKEYAQEKLLPQVNGYQFSLASNGEKNQTQLDITLDVLEAAIPQNRTLTGVMPFDQVQGAQFAFGQDGKLTVHEPPKELVGNSMSPEEIQKQVTQDMKDAGLS